MTTCQSRAPAASGHVRSAPAATLLDRLDGVRGTAPGRWLARCPAHDDRSPSLSICEADDGRVLIHCFGGCSVTDVVAAIGLELRDLFPAQLDDHRRRPTRPGERWVPRDVIRALADETLVILLAAEDVAAGRAMSDEDRQRVATAEARIRSAAREVGCHV